MINIVAAIGKNREIGYQNELLWKLPKDLAYFKNLTTGKIVVMGYNTYKSIGRLLPNRKNIILSTKDIEVEGAEVFSSVWDLLLAYGKEDLYIIGGAQVYRQFIDKADKLYITKVNAEFPHADTFFPPLPKQWEVVSLDYHEKDEKNTYDQTYLIYEKRK